jgi:DNA transposition AAA+ family ATPase
MIDKYTLSKTRKDLEAYKGNDAFLAANAALLLALPDDEAAPILSAVAALSEGVRNMGTLLAFEAVIKLARKLAVHAEAQ